MLLKCNSLRNYHYFILLPRKTDQKRWTFRRSINRVFITSINNDQPPLRFLLSNARELIQGLKHRHPFLPFQRKILYNYLSIGLTCKLNVTKILILELGMISYDPIMNKEYFPLLIKMRMRIAIYFLPTGRPSCMRNTTSRKSSLWHHLINDFIYAACLLQSMLRIFNQSALIPLFVG